MELRETTIPPFPLRDLGMRKAGECRSTQGWEHWRQQARSEHTAVQKRDPRLEKLTAPASLACDRGRPTSRCRLRQGSTSLTLLADDRSTGRSERGASHTAVQKRNSKLEKLTAPPAVAGDLGRLRRETLLSARPGIAGARDERGASTPQCKSAIPGWRN